MSKDGFATFFSDDLPGFNSLNGSGFFDQVGDWNDLDESSTNPANEDGFDADCFEVVRSASSAEDIYGVDIDEDEEDEFEMDGSELQQQFVVATTTKDASSQGQRSSRRRGTERPKGERKRPTDGKQRRVRRSRTMGDGSDVNRSARTSDMRRIKSSDGTTRKMSNMSRPTKRSENLKKTGLDLGAKLTKLEVTKEAEAPQQGGRRLRRRGSQKELGTDEISVGSRGVQSTAGASVGRRDARRRRATQSHDLLARNLQQFAKANDDDDNRRSFATDLKKVAATGGKEEVWRARRRRSVEARSLPMPAIAA